MGGRGAEVDAAVAASRRGETDKGHCDKQSGAFARARAETRERSESEGAEVYALPFFVFLLKKRTGTQNQKARRRKDDM